MIPLYIIKYCIRHRCTGVIGTASTDASTDADDVPNAGIDMTVIIIVVFVFLFLAAILIVVCVCRKMKKTGTLPIPATGESTSGTKSKRPKIVNV